MSTDRVTVLVAAAGAAWEAEALDRLERGPGTVLHRRCVDLTDLLATANAGAASVAVVSPELTGLDADSVATLGRCGLQVVVVAAPEQLLDGDAERLRRLGVRHLLSGSELSALVETVRGAGEEAGPVGVDVEGEEAEVRALRPPSGRLLVVWGPTGAPGRTTVAVGLATELAVAGQDVLLLDVDAYGGTVAQHLGVLDEASGLLAAARAANTGRLDAALLASCARQVAAHLRVLTGLPRPDRWHEVRPVAFADLLEEVARGTPYAVLDVGFSLEQEPADAFGSPAPQRNDMTLAALRRADEVVVVGAADPVGLARLARGLVELREVVPGVRPRVVVNRTRGSLGWSDREIRGMVEGFVAPVEVHFLPDDRAAADRALMAGRSLAETGESGLRTAMTVLARSVVGEQGPPSRRRRPLRRGRRTGGGRS
jgi:MinD-like ATPase involved in chromosome partitioning or flagellar assembly